MAKIIMAKIDLSKIDKSRIFAGKTGALYYDVQIIINDQPDQYGNDVKVLQGQTKEERENKLTEKVYLGNGKTIWSNEGAKSAPSATPAATSENNHGAADDLPF